MRMMPVKDLLESPGDFDYFPDAPALNPELVRAGLHRPLVVNTATVVWGHGILKVAGDLELSVLPCVEVSGDPESLFVLSLQIENRQDLYSWREKDALCRFAEDHGIDSAGEEVLSLVQSSGSFAIQVGQFRSLGPELQAMVEDRRLDLRSAVRVRDLPGAAIVAIAARPDLSLSRVRQVLGLLLEIRRRDSLAEDALLVKLEEAFASKDLVAELRDQRYPELGSMRKQFLEIRGRLIRGSGLSLEAPENFEGNAFRVGMAFKNSQDIRRGIVALERIAEGSDELFELLQ